MLSRNDILGRAKPTVTKVSTPEWGGHVYVRMLPGEELDDALAILEAAESGGKQSEMLAQACLLFISDSKGRALFRAEDIDAIRKLPMAAQIRCVNAALALNGLTEEALKEIEGNSSGDRSVARGSNSRNSAAVRSPKRKPRRRRAS
jgi:hypothetical protein